MKLLYIGGHFCPADSLQRLLLLAEELVFLDQPSVTFGHWGTIGHDSVMRRFSFDGSPVKVSILTPPSGPVSDLYEPYLKADIENPEFVSAFLDGLRDDNIFAERCLQPQANYGNGLNGKDIRRLLTGDQSLREIKLDLSQDHHSLMYQPQIPEGRRAITKSLIISSSIQVTTALLAATEVGALPVADDETYGKLLALRTSSSNYVGGTHLLSARLGLEFARSIIPDEAIQKIGFKGIFEYREKSKDVYRAWSVELAKLAERISESEMANQDDAIRKMIATELAPNIRDYENEMASIRDKLFSDIIKSVLKWECPAISFAYVTHMSLAGAVATFAAAVKGTAPHVVDYVSARRALKRSHPASYLIGLTRGKGLQR